MSKVNDVSPSIAAMQGEWKLVEALMAGTKAMRALGELALPKWPNEDPDAWEKRRDTATLFPAYRRTVSVMSGKPFSQPLIYEPDVPPQIKDWCEDVDREGVNLHVFAAEMFAESFYGLAGILVEAPPPIQTGGRAPTRAEQEMAGVRPYLVRVKHDQILGWRTESVGGRRVLAQLRIMEHVSEAVGDFGQKTIEQVRVLEPGLWMTYRKTEKGEWVQHEAGTTSLSYVPFVPIYGLRTGFMAGAMPLIDLAYLNVKHWQSQSDQDTILHVARVPILSLMTDDPNAAVTVGAASAVRLGLGAKLEFVEHTGAAIGAGQTALDALEEQMVQAGAELLVKRSGSRTATESANDAEGNRCDLQRMVETFEDSLDAALQMMADLAGLPTGGHVSLYNDFGAAAPVAGRNPADPGIAA